ncbi:MAG: hypothetical protein K0U38_06275 [Epsilonproteobacteria bacterium]|nr:hypothetical protein [Campylobacterota bacterium]
MKDDPFYLSKALTLEASLGVLSVDGNFVKSIAYLKKFVKLNTKDKIWKRPVVRVALIPTSVYITNYLYRSIKTLYAYMFCFYKLFIYANFCRDEGNPTYGFSDNQKDDNLTYFSHKLFLNVNIIKNIQR